MADSPTLLLLTLSLVLNFSRVNAHEEVGVSCAIGSDCVLPCDVQNKSDISILWRKTPGDTTVHTYHSNQDQLQLQHEDYKGRTFLKEILKGEASLLLRDIRITDEGRYMCNTNSSSGSSVTAVDLQVFVSGFKVIMERQGSGLVCRSEGIYPKPEVNWTFVPPRDEVQTRVEQREDGLYDVYATAPHLGCSDCTVQTVHDWSRASMIMYDYHAEYSSAVLRCFAPKCQTNHIWKFNDEVISSRNGSQHFLNKSWSFNVVTVTEFYSLVLHFLREDLEGNYSCYIETEKETVVNVVRLKTHRLRQLKSLSEGFPGVTVWTLGATLSMSFLFGFALHFEMDTGTTLQKFKRYFKNRFKPDKTLSENDADIVNKEHLLLEEEKTIGPK